jgi:hypothetical protein
MPQGADILIPVTKCDLQSPDWGSEPFTTTEKDRPYWIAIRRLPQLPILRTNLLIVFLARSGK